MTIVTHEKRKISIPKVNAAAEMISVSMTIIANAISMEVDFEIILANISVPPLLVSYRSMRPIPIPMMAPPIKELVSIDREKTFFNGLSQSIKRDVRSNP